MELVGKVGSVTVSSFENEDGDMYYLMKHEDGRWLHCPESQFDDDKEALEFAKNFDNNYQAIVDCS